MTPSYTKLVEKGLSSSKTKEGFMSFLELSFAEFSAHDLRQYVFITTGKPVFVYDFNNFSEYFDFMVNHIVEDLTEKFWKA